MAKRYCVDTNILLYDNKFFDNDIFKDGELLITMTSISEIDHIKEHSKNQELKFKARNASRDLEDAVEEGKIKIIKTDGSCADESFSCYEVMDDLIISTIKANSLEDEIIAVSRDYNFRLKCNGVGIPTSNYTDDKSFDNLSDLYTGVIETEVSDDLVNLFYKQGFIFYKDLKLDRKPYPNEFIIARSNINSKRKIVARYIHSNKRFEKLVYCEDNVLDRNKIMSSDDYEYWYEYTYHRKEDGFVENIEITSLCVRVGNILYKNVFMLLVNGEQTAVGLHALDYVVEITKLN